MSDWTEKELIEWWDERAAIRQFEGELGVQRANFLAAKELRERFGTVPRQIAEKISRGEKLEQQRNLFDNDVPN